jgi:cytochrome P450
VAFGRGLVTDLDDDSWRSRRTLVQPVFGKRHVDGFATQMTDAVARTAERWQRTSREGRPLDVAAEMNAVTLDIIGSTMFGTDLTGPDAERMREAFARMLRLFGDGVMSGGAYHARRIANVLWRLGPRRHEPQDPMLVVRVLRAFTRVTEPRTYKGLRWLMRFIQDMVAEYRADPEQREDNLLALLVDATDPDTGRGLTDAQVRDELMTFLGAGHETTASGLAWTWLLLSRHPDVRARLQDELDTVLGGRTPTVEDLEALPWTRAVVEESMRLYPPIMGVGRVARGDDQLGTIPIRQGETIVVLIHGIHHNPDVWPDPERFDPERFMPGRPGPGSRLATMPFGAGRRGCIAATFARMEATLIMAMLSQRFELDLREQPPIRRQNTFTGGPEGAVWMDVRERV